MKHTKKLAMGTACAYNWAYFARDANLWDAAACAAFG